MTRFILLILATFLMACSESADKDTSEAGEASETVVQEETPKPAGPTLSFEEVTFPSKDSLPITADVYIRDGKEPLMLLCHQAGFSRGEYHITALKINQAGYSCMAIDQRSGKEANGVVNETAQKAKEKSLPTDYQDARQDIEAAIDYLYERSAHHPIILVGSSYSASLALLIARDNPKVRAVAAFSPGEYFKGTDIQKELKGMSTAVFVTSSQKETPGVEKLVSAIDQERVTHFKPKVAGIHGSRALWSSTEGNEAYWKAFLAFVEEHL
jgi:dienelactone hydrolase